MPQLTPEQAIEGAENGRLRPVYLVLGEELFYRQQVLAAMRKAVLGGGGASLNEDQFVAGEVDVKAVIGVASSPADDELLVMRSMRDCCSARNSSMPVVKL